MGTDLVAWFGPVAEFQVEGATVPGAREHFFGCHGALVKPICMDVAWGFQQPDGRSLPGMVEQAGLTEAELGDVFLGAFSAGGRVVRRLVFDERDAARVRAVLLSDATYASWRDAAKRIPLVQDELLRFCERLAEAGSDQLLVATASPSPNFNLPTGVEVLQQLRSELEQRTGRKFTKLGHFYGVEPAPKAAYRLGNVVLAEYPLEPLGHKHTDIAPQVWQRILLPWLSELRAPAPEPPPPAPQQRQEPELPLVGLGPQLLAFGAGALVGYLALRRLMAPPV